MPDPNKQQDLAIPTGFNDHFRTDMRPVVDNTEVLQELREIRRLLQQFIGLPDTPETRAIQEGLKKQSNSQ